MQVPSFIRQIPEHVDTTLIQIVIKGAEAKQWIENYWIAKRQAYEQSDLHKEYLKPFYERHIEPLNQTDYLLLGGSLAAAAVVSLLAVKLFTIAALPLALGVGTLMIMGAYSISRYRVRKHFEKIAWEEVDEIRKTAHNTTYQNQHFDVIRQHRARLQQPEFEHLSKLFEDLDKEIRSFNSAALNPDYRDNQHIVKTHLTVLKGIVQGDPADEALIAALEAEIDKVGQPNQDLKALEMQKQKLHDLKTPAVLPHLVDLLQQINALVKAAVEGPTFDDRKKAFREYLEGLQRKINEGRDITVLP